MGLAPWNSRQISQQVERVGDLGVGHRIEENRFELSRNMLQPILLRFLLNRQPARSHAAIRIT